LRSCANACAAASALRWLSVYSRHSIATPTASTAAAATAAVVNTVDAIAATLAEITDRFGEDARRGRVAVGAGLPVSRRVCTIVSAFEHRVGQREVAAHVGLASRAHVPRRRSARRPGGRPA